ncbi:hypothetical protein ScPMuIL_002342 [Solemya velum]
MSNKYLQFLNVQYVSEEAAYHTYADTLRLFIGGRVMAHSSAMGTEDSKKALFRDINAEDDDPEVMEMESLCLRCEEQGLTRLFLTKIPFFREVIVSSFFCDHCGFKNSELQSGGRIQDKGVCYTLTVRTAGDMNRQVVQTNTATVSIPQLEFEIPPNKGGLTTVEGVLDKAVEGLEQDQPVRRVMHPDIAEKIDGFVKKMKSLKSLDTPFDLYRLLNLVTNAPHKDYLVVTHYVRSKEQNEQVGILEPEDGTAGEEEETQEKAFDAKQEVLTFPANCPNCGVPCMTNMKMLDIPYFKEVIIMATVCEVCGNRENEVKGGAGIAEKGTKISLNITDRSDMSRDVLKSDTCSISIPEFDFDTEMGTLGGKFTTVEGLLENIIDQLKESNPFFHGDSSQPDMVDKISAFCGKIKEIITGERLGVHFVLDDPAGNSYLQNVYAPEEDPEMEVVHYERSYDQKESLGLNDMVTENYSS